ncbi:MAG: hypothetical protein WC761_00030 [Candidatus Paceibacterota bacterium]|jgi:hypothetical protein
MLVCSIIQADSVVRHPIIYGSHDEGPLAGHFKMGSQWFFFAKEVALVLETRQYFPYYEQKSFHPNPDYKPQFTHEHLKTYHKILYREGIWFVETSNVVEFTGSFPVEGKPPKWSAQFK